MAVFAASFAMSLGPMSGTDAWSGGRCDADVEKKFLVRVSHSGSGGASVLS